MVGRELSPYAGYIVDRASEELGVTTSRIALLQRLSSAYIAVFGVPEVGAHVRINSALAEIPPDARTILDIGCGPGMLMGQLERLPSKPQVTGIEIDRNAASIATKAHPRSQVLTGDFLTATLPEGGFDCATMIDVLEHVPDGELLPFLRRARSLIKPGGTLIMHVPADDQRRHFAKFRGWEHHDHEREGFKSEQLHGLLTESGFSDVQTKGTFGYWGSLGWELNMLVAGNVAQAVVFPLALATANLDRLTNSHKYNGLLAIAHT